MLDLLLRQYRNTKPGATMHVIDSTVWLRRHVEQLLAQGRGDDAIDYLQRLLSRPAETDVRRFCHTNLGVILFERGSVDAAREQFESALRIGGDPDPRLAHALGHCSLRESRPWTALTYFLEALSREPDESERAEYMRGLAKAFDAVGQPRSAGVVLLGARDRAPENVRILDSLGEYCEDSELWMEALQWRDQLADVLRKQREGGSSPDLPAIFRPALSRVFDRVTIDEAMVRARIEAIIRRLRQELRIAVEAESGPSSTSGAAPIRAQLPAGLRLLVESLLHRRGNIALLETALALWARARHDELDVYLTPERLAAAIQLLCERRHWRIPTVDEDLERMYAVDIETIRGAARVLVARYDVAILETSAIPPVHRKAVLELSHAWLLGIDPDAIRQERRHAIA